ncbi:hypothetical protein HDV02_001991 [Globomyces sp. JEL0801]|nr:hypothetical protein HDV02_001991 [Globomyces sp. JEL0801]
MSKKQKAVKMDLGSFLKDETMGGSWADEVTDLPTALENNHIDTSSHGGYSKSDMPDIPIPENPPYTAFIGNLSFQVSDRDVNMFFGDLRIKSVRLIVDMQTQRSKGYGYVEFEDRESLVSAIQMNGETLMNRSVRLNVAESGPKSRGGRPDDSKFASNWRTRPPADADRSFRDNFSSRQNEREHHGFGGPRRDEGGFGGPRRDGGGFGGFRRNSNDQARGPRDFGNRHEGEESPRPAPAPSKPKVNPFGNASARDEYAMQQQIEERRMAREAEKEAQKAKEQQARDEIAAKAKADRESRAQRDDDKSKKQTESKVPEGQGSWRRPASKPVQKPVTKIGPANPTPAEEKKFKAFGNNRAGEEKSKNAPKAKKTVADSNVFALLGEDE